MTESTRSKLKLLKIIVWCILGAILLFVLIVVGSLLVQKYIKKSVAPMFAGYGWYIVVTDSMTGTINKGDMIIVKKADEYGRGDIVTYREDGGNEELITHGIVEFGPEEGTYITMGYATGSRDPYPIPEEWIVGKVVHTIPKVGAVIDWFLDGGGIIYTVAILAVAVAAVYFWNYFKPEEEDKEDGKDES